MTNPFWYTGPKIPSDKIDTEYVYWYYHRSWRAPWFWLRVKLSRMRSGS